MNRLHIFSGFISCPLSSVLPDYSAEVCVFSHDILKPSVLPEERLLRYTTVFCNVTFIETGWWKSFMGSFMFKGSSAIVDKESSLLSFLRDLCLIKLEKWQIKCGGSIGGKHKRPPKWAHGHSYMFFFQGWWSLSYKQANVAFANKTPGRKI